jgi:hypothetical protein
LSLVAGYAVETPEISKYSEAPTFSFRRLARKLGDAFMAAQRRRVEREVALLISRNGGLLSDEVERKLARQFGV